MPYFKDKNILFIHIPKNGGMYVEKCLGIPHQIVSHESPLNLNITTRLRSGLGALVNVLRTPSNKNALGRECVYGYFGGSMPFQHATLNDVIQLKLVPKYFLQKCTVLAVHRHPVDRALSIYKYWGLSKRMSFREYCERWLLEPHRENLTLSQMCHVRTQCSYLDTTYPLTNELVTLPFDGLSGELDFFLNSKGISAVDMATKVNVSKQEHIVVDADSARIIEDVYSCDFQRFNYRFSGQEN